MTGRKVTQLLIRTRKNKLRSQCICIITKDNTPQQGIAESKTMKVPNRTKFLQVCSLNKAQIRVRQTHRILRIDWRKKQSLELMVASRIPILKNKQ